MVRQDRKPILFFSIKAARRNPSLTPAGSWPKNEKGGKKCQLMNFTVKNVKKLLVS
jgi:hypothetical protein